MMKKFTLVLLLLSCLGARAHGQAKSESMWLDWQTDAINNGLIKTSNIGDAAFDLFPDSTVKINNGAGGYAYNQWHSMGEIFDVHSQTLRSGTTQYYLDNKTAYAFDSINFAYAYIHSIADTSIKDTLIFDFYANYDLNRAYFNVSYIPTILDSFNIVTSTSLDYKKQIKYVLKLSDTSYLFKRMAMPVNIPITANGICGYSVTFKPGYKYSLGDTLNPLPSGKVPYKKLDDFRMWVLADFGKATDSSYNFGVGGLKQVKYFSKTGSAWDSLYIPGNAFTSYYLYLYFTMLHITTANLYNDAGVTKILSPSGSNICSGPQDVKVVIKNFDEDTLTSVNITDTVFGGMALYYAWTGSLPKGGTDTVDLGNYTFTTGSVLMKAWTWAPNGGTDSFAGDDTSTISFTAIAPPSAATGGNQYICTGGSVAIGLAAVSGETYSWVSVPPGFTSTSANPTVSPTTTTQYQVTVTNTSTGCDSASKYLTVTVNHLPILNVANAKICTGSTVTIGPSAQGGVAYSWTASPKGYTSTAANPVLTPTVNTTYYVYAINTSKCSDSDSVVVTIVPNPIANAGSSQTICGGTSTTIGAPSVSGLTYKWTANPGKLDSTSGNPTVSPLVTTTYYLIATNTTACTATDSVVITVSTVGDLAGKATSICLGSSAIIGDSVAGVTYLWSASGTSGFSSAYAQPTVNPTATTTYYLTATNALSCTSSSSVVVSIWALPVVSLDSSKNVCAGSSVQIGVANNTQYSYSWSSSDGSLTSKSNNPTVTPTASTTYYLTATDKSTQCSVNDTIPVNYFPMPTVSAGANDSISYSTQAVQLTGSPAGGTWSGTGITAAGYFNPSTIGVGNSVTLKYTYTNAGGCSASATRTVKVFNGDDAGISAITGPAASTVKTGTYTVTVTLKNFGAAELTAVNIHWAINSAEQTINNWTGNLITGATTPVTLGSFDFKKVQNYTLQAWTDSPNVYTDVNDANDTASEKLGITLSAIDNAIAARFDVNIYPNPFSSYTYINYTLAQSEDVKIDIYDMTGKEIVGNAENNQAPGKHIFTFDPSVYGASSGMYLVKLMIGGEQVAKTVVMIK